jgi:hypothetical protein
MFKEFLTDDPEIRYVRYSPGKGAQNARQLTAL